MSKRYKIGYIDEDIKQVKLYARKLREFGFEVIGYDFVKGITLESLMDQVFHSDIELLMIDYKLNESNIVTFNGEVVEKIIYECKPLFPHIIFTNKVDQAEPFVEDWKIIFDKEEIFSDEDNKENVEYFVTMLKKSIEQYQSFVNKKKMALSDLLKKGEEKGLNAAEKSTLLTLQDELNNLDKTKKNEVPKHLISYKNLEDLSNSNKEAEEFLNSLIKKGKRK